MRVQNTKQASLAYEPSRERNSDATPVAPKAASNADTVQLSTATLNRLTRRPVFETNAAESTEVQSEHNAPWKGPPNPAYDIKDDPVLDVQSAEEPIHKKKLDAKAPATEEQAAAPEADVAKHHAQADERPSRIQLKDKTREAGPAEPPEAKATASSKEAEKPPAEAAEKPRAEAAEKPRAEASKAQEQQATASNARSRRE